MYDLRAAVKTTIDAWIDSTSPDYIEKCHSFKSTQDALDNIENVVFTNAAVLLGDWISEPEQYTFSNNKVRNELELLVATKSKSAQAAIATIINDLSTLLYRNRFDETETLITHISSADSIEKKENVYYKILTLSVLALEDVDTPTGDFPILINWISPGEDRTLQVNDPYTVLSLIIKYKMRGVRADYVIFMARRMPALFDTENGYCYVSKIDANGNYSGEITTSFTLFHTSTKAVDYMLYAVIFDTDGVCGVATRKVSFTLA